MNTRTTAIASIVIILCVALVSPARAGTYCRVGESVYVTILTTHGYVHPFPGALTAYSSYPGADLSYADLHDGYLRGIELPQADLSDSDLSGAEMYFMDLSYANMQDADLSDAILISADLTAATLFGVNLDNTVLDGATFYAASLGAVDLRTASLVATNFHYVNIQNADLRGADLSLTKLGGAILDGADFSGADLSSATFEMAPTGSAWYDKNTIFGAFDPIAAGWRLRRSSYAGDFNGDTYINVADIDLLAAAMRAGSTDAKYDLNGDGALDLDDIIFMVETLVDTDLGFGTGTAMGDFNLDGEVGLLDLARLGEGYNGSGGWLWGDANGDGVVGLTDLAWLGENYGYDGSAVPEPMTMSLLALGGVVLIRRRK